MFSGFGPVGYPLYSYSGPTTGFILQAPHTIQKADGDADIDSALEDGDRKRRASPSSGKEGLSHIHSVRIQYKAQIIV